MIRKLYDRLFVRSARYITDSGSEVGVFYDVFTGKFTFVEWPSVHPNCLSAWCK